METIDPETKRQQLAETYSQMSDQQLEELAADNAALTETAREVLQAEMNSRGLTTPPEETPPADDTDDDSELVTIRLFRDLPEALVAKGVLETAGIECYLADDNMVRLDWFISSAIGNMRLQVKEDDAVAALEVLDQPSLENEVVDESD
jgi:hypothetical protein